MTELICPTLFAIACAAMVLAVADAAARDGAEPEPFALWRDGQLRGANVLLRKPGGEIASAGFSDDLKILRSWGANLAEIAVNDVFQPGPPYRAQPEELAGLDRLVDDAEKAGLFVVLTCRTGPGRADFHYSYEIWSDADAQEAYARMWEHLALRYRGREHIVGYDLMCEPHPDDPHHEKGMTWAQCAEAMRGTLSDWNILARRLTAAIREVDSRTPILVNSTCWGGPHMFDYLELTGDPKTVYVAHFYGPGRYAGQKPEEPIPYPGVGAVGEALAPVRQFHEKHRVPIFVGEFGCRRWALSADEYLGDQIGLYERWGWSWAYWVFRESDGMDLEKSADPNDKKRHPDTVLLRMLRSCFSRNTMFAAPS